jgi:GT2 family glycosyltransferase/glycosyltransferase involved in cell wall biosynthesis
MGSWVQDDIRLVRESGLFDEAAYLRRYPDVQKIGLDPVEHYLWIGEAMGRSPGPSFSPQQYYTINVDVAAAELSALAHYVRYGSKEGRRKQLSELDPLARFHPGAYSAKPGAMTVLVCAHEVNQQLFGGERSFVDMVSALSECELNVIVALPSANNNEYIERMAGLSCGVLIFKYPIWSVKHNYSEKIIREFCRIIHEYQVDVVYTNTIMLREAHVAAARMRRASMCHVRELITLDKHLIDRIGAEPAQIIETVTRQASAIIANSAKTAEMFDRSANVFVAPNIVDLDELDLENTVAGPVRFGIISSNIKKKGIEDFIEIARLSERAGVDAEFVIIGPENDFIKGLLSLDLPVNLSFAGYSPSPREAIRKINVLMSLSHFAESFGRTVAEAQAARRPVIAYAWGAIPELVDDGRSGYLVPHRDIAAAAAAVATLALRKARIAEMGAAGREKMAAGYSRSVLRDNLRRALQKITRKPVTLRALEAPVEAAPTVAAATPSGKSTTIIVPVYNAPADVGECLASLRRFTDFTRSRVIVIDDASPSPEIEGVLAPYADLPGFSVVRNECNLGYTRTVNKGIVLAGADDVVLLNSDTIVTPGWLDGLRSVAYASADVGTVTAMSDNAGAFSFPKAQERNLKPGTVSHELWSTVILRATEDCDPVEVPTGNGFCMFVRRAVFDQVGAFDEELFPRGYGEENEFCMRALAAGWRNLISPKSYVFHERSKSFGEQKTALIAAGMAEVAKKFPTYARQVKAAFSSPAMMRLREAAERAFTPEAIGARLDQGADPSDLRRFARLNDVLINWDDIDTRLAARRPDMTSIIVCVFNNPTLTRKCLDSILLHTRDSFEVVVVDNGSNEETARLLDTFAAAHPAVRVVRNFENLNFALGNNVGFAASRGGRVVFLNNDTEVTRDWLEPLLRPLDDPRIKGSQPKLLFPNGKLQCIGVAFSGRGPFGYAIYSNEDGSSRVGASARTFRAVTAACLAMRAEDFARARGFDPMFINGQEDVDLCLRVGNGRPVFSYVPDSVVVHFEGKSAGRGRHVVHNRRVFADRWTGRFAGDDASYYEADGVEPGGYTFDNEELEKAGIGLWRPATLVYR